MNTDKLFFFIQALLRYFPYQLGLYLRQKIYPYFFNSFGKNVRIYDSVVIKYPSQITLGNDCTINQFCYIVGKGGLTIGNDVMVGAGSKMTTTSHDFERTDIPMRLQGISCKPIAIEEDVWIGFNVVILGGSVIKKGSIVATGCVVNGIEFPIFAVIGGTPAKQLKSRNYN